MQVHVEPTQATAVPGAAVTLVAVVRNDGDTERTCTMRIVGLEPQWVEHSIAFTVPAGSRLEAPVRVTLPHGFPRGEQLIGVEVTPDGEAPTLAEVTLSVSDLESLHLGITPVTVRGGWRGRFKLNIENRGTDPLTLELSGRGVGPAGTRSDLSFQFKPAEITLRPGERVKTRGAVSAHRPVFGAPRRRALTVTAQGQTAPRHVQGAFVQRPLMTRNVMRVIGIVLMLGMWAGALGTGVRLTSRDSKANAQDAASVTDAGGAGGAGGKDGGANGSGTEEVVAPVTGGAVAGQVKGPADPGGVHVSLRPVALADDLSEDITLISSTGDTGKDSAQTLRREPAGPLGPTASTSTDGSGRWAFGGLKSPANYELTFSKAGYSERTYIVTLDDKTPTVALDVSLVPGNGAISGTVKGPKGPLGGVAISVTDGSVTLTTTTPTTGDVGHWSIGGLSTPGTYVVTASLRGYGTETTSVTLDSGGADSGVDLTMVAGVGSISGHVSGAGSRLGNIDVSATDGKVTRSASTLTEGDPGSYALPQLPIPGDYTISVSGDGWIPQTLALHLTGNSADVDLDLVTTTATVVGTVSDTSGTPLPSTGVTLAQDKPIVKTLSAIEPAGSYELTGLAPGSYTLTFDRADFKTESTIVTVTAGERKVVDTTLTPQVGDSIPHDATVRGIVRSSSTGDAIAGAEVAMNGTVATTDPTGGFVFEKLAPGSYDVEFSHASYQPTTRTLRVAAASDTTIDVTMLPLGGIQGVVTDLTASPLEGVTVTITNDPAATDQEPFTATTTTDASGQYSVLEKLRTGKYVATFTKAHYQDRSRNFEAAAGTVATGDITLIELAQIHGTVQAPDSGTSGGFTQLTDVTIKVERKNASGAWEPFGDPITDADGEFLVIDLQPGDYRETVSKDGYGDSVKELLGIKLREVRDGGVILTPAAQTVTGRLTYLDGGGARQPVVGAKVTAQAVVGFETLTIFPYVRPKLASLEGVSDTNGDWSIKGQVAGSTSTYNFTALGFRPASLNISPPTAPGANDVTLVAFPRDVAGTVTLDGADPATFDFSTVDVEIKGGPITRLTHPGTDGRYGFDDLPLDDYVVTVSSSGFKSVSQPVTLGPGDPAVAVEVPESKLVKYSSITPTVTDAAGNPLKDVAVTLDGGAAALTGTDGRTATFGQLSAGTYTITYNKGGFEPVTRTLTLVAGVDATAANFPTELAVTLLRWPTLSLHLQSRFDGATTDLDGVAASVTAVRTAAPAGQSLLSPEPTIAFSGSGSGAYTSTDVVRPGTYTITAAPALHVKATVDATVAAGTTPAAAPLVLDHLARVTVTARSQVATDTYNPLSTATIAVAPGAGVTTSHATGTNVYVADGLVAGTYDVTVTAPFHDPETLTTPALALAQSYATGADLLAWPKLSVHVLSHYGTAPDTDLTGAATSITAVRTDGSMPPPPSCPPSTPGCIYFEGGAGGVYTSTEPVPSGTYTITAAPAGYVEGTDTATATAGQPSTQASITLQKYSGMDIVVSSKLDGTLTDLTAATATVTVKNVENNAKPKPPTIVGNTWSFEGLKPGTYEVTVSATNHVEQTTQVVVTAGVGSSTPVDLLAYPPQKLTATSRASADKPFDSESPLVGATVTLKATAGGASTTLTHQAGDAAGVYTNANITPGTYTVTVAATGYEPSTQTDVVIAGGVTHGALSALLTAKPGGITGTIRDTAGNPLQGVTVTAQASGKVLPSFTTLTDGKYSFTGIAPVTWSVTYQLSTYSTLTQSVTVAPDTTATANAVLVQLGATLTGKTLGRATDAVVSTTDNPAKPLGGVTVSLTRTGFSTPDQTVQDDGAGNQTYGFSNVPAGTYKITFTHPDYKTWSRDITVTVAQVLSLTDTLVAKSAEAHFTVHDSVSDAPVRNVTLRISGALLAGGHLDSTATAADGTTTVSSLAPGTYQVTYTSVPTGYSVDSTATTVVVPYGGGTYTVPTLNVDHLADLDVTVTGLLGTDTALISIKDGATEVGTGSVTGSTTTTTKISNLPVGRTLTVAVSNAKYTFPTAPTVTLAASEYKQDLPDIVATPKPGSIDLTVTGLLDSDKASASITWPGQTGGAVLVSDLAEDMMQTIAGLPAGKVLSIDVASTHYTSPSTTSLTLGADEQNHVLTRSLTAKPGTLVVNVTGLLTGDSATATLSNGITRIVTLANGPNTITGVTAGQSFDITIGATKYSGALNRTGIKLTAEGSVDLGTLALTPNDGSVNVTVGPNTLSGSLVVTATATWTGGTSANTGKGAGVINIPNVKAGVPVTVTVTATGFTADGPKSVTLGAEEAASAGTVTLTATPPPPSPPSVP